MARRPAEAAVAAAEGRLRQRGETLAAVLIENGAFHVDERALARALVDDVDHARAPHHRAARRQRPVDRHALLAVQHLDPVYSGIEVADPEAGIAEHGRHGRQGLERRLGHEG
jgi:hypothetical protein